ncbi:Flagellar hook-basal body complex protein FliE [Pleomorphomonas sp. T1.2MG-36]|uniref:flagellar hook-basal body complex protein FliE n=1 Tax=Pleomorphomonas sp. T1.2MG-36 TaxID=3041167 RepID=UPI0024778D02|nr:flagellar hook-basal body complex protein FliE [Pleomorphomonas sp. T1.2MG-36]CAI9402475.1 Flagellar hook-basal body complex protein FliE [Pleomorphomonas sp. T1.2MG-36]
MALTTTALSASNVYGAMSRLANRGQAGQASDAVAGAAGVTSPDFGSMLRDQVRDVVDQGNASEAKQASYMAGKGNIIDVVTAVSEAEVALDTMVSVRDKVISAYEEIMRMAI